ncbi:DUF4157 domain-containing protein [Hymenobacter sp. BT188]|uniref:eCIS core domain-containing protein n=1 Tax=Hymenobacter sp. BT188 TaxID=2763504 RepID=UPI0016513026|nr:DUF4157 domain-containing protein [Hymenobacter sp. BT188]MBC6608776.1 DUF4157 domain-containing protein [Hymenobacter sp. BT188]
MKIKAAKSVHVTPPLAATRTAQPFFEQAGRSDFFRPAKPATHTHPPHKVLRPAADRPDVVVQGRASTAPLPGSGTPLPEAFRREAERHLSADFSAIRLHRDKESTELNKQLQAQAVVFQEHIFLGQGEFQPTAGPGKSLLAQGLLHAWQEGAVRLKPQELSAPTPLVTPTEPADRSPAQPQPATPATPTLGGKSSETKPQVPGAAGPETIPQPGPKTDEAQEAEAPVQMAPKTPQEDPEFGKVITQTQQVKKAQQGHKAPEVKNTAVAASAHLPVAEQKAYNDRKKHLDVINQTAATNKDANKKFTAAQFKKLLQAQLSELEKKLPHSKSDAQRFKHEKPLEGIKNNVKKQVQEENKNVAAPITAETHKPTPPDSQQPTHQPKPLVEEKAGAKPPPIDPAAAAPKPRTDAEISLAKDSQSLDALMAKNNNTEEQFAASNEPKFQQALATKKGAQAQAAAAPQTYRADEQQVIGGAQQQALKDAKADFGMMYALRRQGFKTVFTKQSEHDKADKDEQKRIKGELETIYNGTKNEVEAIFTALGKYVEDTFEKDSRDAKDAFEKRVEEQLDAIHGWGVKAFFFGEDTEAIEKVFEAEKRKFIDAMDLTIGAIAQRIADDLNKAVEAIQRGKTKAESFYNGLSTKQQTLVGDAVETYRVQFANLESGVAEKQTELARSLAESYKKDVDSLRQVFDKIYEDVRKTWIQRAAEFIEEVALTIYRLGELLVTVLVRVAHVVGDILAHPIRFLENLAAGIKQGFATFVENFDTFLIEGFFAWLGGKVSGAGTKLPPKLDTAGLFRLALQVIGLTYDNFRDIARQRLGDPVFAALEKGVEGAQEVNKLIQLARADIGALWTHIKEVLANTVEEIFEKIKKTVLYETIKKVLAYIVTLFNPAGAFIKAAQAIYAGITFLMDNIERIVALVNAFLDGVEMAVQGNIGGIASKVIFGLKNAIVAGIDFLAKLLGLGNLADKVRTIIKQLKTPVDRALGFVVDKVLQPAAKLLHKAGKAIVGAGVPKDPAQRLEAGLSAAVAVVNAISGRQIGAAVIRPLLTAIRIRYQFQSLDVEARGGRWFVVGQLNPKGSKPSEKEPADAPATPGAAPVAAPLLVAPGSWIENLQANGFERVSSSGSVLKRSKEAGVTTLSFTTTTLNGGSNTHSYAGEGTSWRRHNFRHSSNLVTLVGSGVNFVLMPQFHHREYIRETLYSDTASSRAGIKARLLPGRLVPGSKDKFLSQASAALEASHGYTQTLNGEAVIPVAHASPDHDPAIAEHWSFGGKNNTPGNNITQPARENWNRNLTTFKLMSLKANLSLGSRDTRYTNQVGADFRGPGE